jgi:hypothetical protein
MTHTPAASQNCGSSQRVMLSECPANECASGTAELGSYLTDATREGRSQRAVVNSPLR